MRKVVVISVLFVVLLVTGLVLYFSWRERKAEQEAMAIFKDMFECPYEEARQKVEAHYVWMSGLYTQLDSLGPERILTAGDRGAYRDFLRSQQEVPLHVMSYEVLYQANRKYYEDTLELSVNWPWLGVYQPAWLRWPLLDTNMAHGLLTSYSIKGDLCATSRQLTEISTAAT